MVPSTLKRNRRAKYTARSSRWARCSCSLVERHRTPQTRGQVAQQAFNLPPHARRLPVLDLGGTQETRFPLDQSDQATLVSTADNAVTFPIAEAGASIDDLGASVDADALRNLPAAVRFWLP